MASKKDPPYNEKLAGYQRDAAAEATAGAGATSEAEWDCWWTHGLISGTSNGQAGVTEGARRNAALAVAKASDRLATWLDTAAIVYTAVENDLEANLKAQMHLK